ncbi:MAG: hypothetical protein ACC609_00280 [Methanobacterium formicicum]
MNALLYMMRLMRLLNKLYGIDDETYLYSNRWIKYYQQILLDKYSYIADFREQGRRNRPRKPA